MNRIGFDNDKYVTLQSERIRQRISELGGKLYLEFGGKLFDDYHASRVLPGFQPDSKIRMLMEMKDEAETMGSPRGASFISVASAPGMTPISKKCCRRAPSPPTASIRALCPGFRSFSVTCDLSPFVSRRRGAARAPPAGLHGGAGRSNGR